MRSAGGPPPPLQTRSWFARLWLAPLLVCSSLLAHAFANPTGFLPTDAPCVGTMDGSWERAQSVDPPVSALPRNFRTTLKYGQRVTVESWRFLPAPGTCDVNRFDLAGALARLRGRRLVFIGDSLVRNMMNAVYDLMEADKCVATRPTGLYVDGRVSHPGMRWRKCNRPNGPSHAVVPVPAHNLTIEMVWTPKLPPWGDANCTADLLRTELLSFTLPKYYDAQLSRDCAHLATMLDEVLTDDRALVVTGYSAIHTMGDEFDDWMRDELPPLLQRHRERLVFATHYYKVPKVQKCLTALVARGVPAIAYGPIAQRTFWYDEKHVAGPAQWAAARATLWTLAELVPCRGQDGGAPCSSLDMGSDAGAAAADALDGAAADYAEAMNLEEQRKAKRRRGGRAYISGKNAPVASRGTQPLRLSAERGA